MLHWSRGERKIKCPPPFCPVQGEMSSSRQGRRCGDLNILDWLCGADECCVCVSVAFVAFVAFVAPALTDGSTLFSLCFMAVGSRMMDHCSPPGLIIHYSVSLPVVCVCVCCFFHCVWHIVKIIIVNKDLHTFMPRLNLEVFQLDLNLFSFIAWKYGRKHKLSLGGDLSELGHKLTLDNGTRHYKVVVLKKVFLFQFTTNNFHIWHNKKQVKISIYWTDKLLSDFLWLFFMSSKYNNKLH